MTFEEKYDEFLNKLLSALKESRPELGDDDKYLIPDECVDEFRKFAKSEAEKSRKRRESE